MYKYMALLLILTGCASPGHWQSYGTANSNVYAAHNDCTTRTAMTVRKQGDFDFMFSARVNNFMKECMMGNGYSWELDEVKSE